MEWLNKLRSIVEHSNDDNPTVTSTLYMLNHMIEEYGAYKAIGTADDFVKYKQYYEKRH